MRTCNNCKYSKGWHDPDPCNTCRFLADDRNNWEPMEGGDGMNERKDAAISVTALMEWLTEYEKKAAKLKGRYFPLQVIGWLKTDLFTAIDSAMEATEAKE